MSRTFFSNADNSRRIDHLAIAPISQFYEHRRANNQLYPASGIVNFGNQHDNPPNYEAINEGFFTRNASSQDVNLFAWGRANGSGSSKTDWPVVNIAGAVSHLRTNESASTYNYIRFPEAERGTRIYDSSRDCRGSGKAALDLAVDVDPKYGDVAADADEAVARAFDGMFRNSDFRAGTDHWKVAATHTLTVTDGVATLFNPAGTWTALSTEPNSATNRKANTRYKFEIVLESVINVDSIVFRVKGSNSTVDAVEVDLTGVTFPARITAEVLSTSDTNSANFGFYNSGNSGQDSTLVISRFSCHAVTEEVVIDRHDIFGLESFLRKIYDAETDTWVGHAYPWGNIQSVNTQFNGVATIEDPRRPDSFYAQYIGDTQSRGLGVDMSVQSPQYWAEVSGTEHHIYRMPNGDVVQWCIRMRTIAGAGNGDWYNVESTGASSWGAGLTMAPGVVVRAQGINDVRETFSSNMAVTYVTQPHASNPLPYVGAFTSRDSTVAYQGECHFITLAITQRLNQGAFHPTLNRLGTGYWHYIDSPVGTTNGKWRRGVMSADIHSTAQAFDRSSVGAPRKYHNSGGINQVNGRVDSRCFNLIYSSGLGGVTDLRLSAHDITPRIGEIREEIKSGEFRGVEKLSTVKVYAGPLHHTGTGELLHISDSGLGNQLTAGGKVFLLRAGVVEEYQVVNFSSVDSVSVSPSIPDRAAITHVVAPGVIDSSVSGNFQAMDVIGHPADILATPELASGWVGGWSPAIPPWPTAFTDYLLSRKQVANFEVENLVYKNTNDVANEDWKHYGILDGTSDNTINTSLNALRVQVTLALYTYTAYAKQTEPADNAVVHNAIEGVGHVLQTSSSDLDKSVLLAESLSGKLGTTDASIREGSVYMQSTMIGSGNNRMSSEYPALHAPLTLASPNNAGPGLKVLFYDVTENQQMYPHFAWTELSHNGTDWGDDSQIHIVDQTSTRVDQNGTTVSYGTARTTLPVGWTK